MSNKMHIKTAIQSRKNTFDLSHKHITSLGWMQMNCSMICEMVPQSSIDVNMEQFVRLSSMPSPTFGRATIRNRAFFVPFRTIMPDWNKFISHLINSNELGSYIPSVPHVTNELLCDFLFAGSVDGESLSVVIGTGETRDFLVYDSDGTPYNKKFTARGRYVLKVLNQLGYHPTFNQNVVSPYSWPDMKYSALPLLALCRIYYDWYSSPQYQTVEASYKRFEKLLDFRSSSSYALTKQNLMDIFLYLYQVGYDPDYFTSAWQNPLGPNMDSSSALNPTISFVDNNLTSSEQRSLVTNENSSQGTPVLAGLNASSVKSTAPYNITQNALNLLHAVTDWVMRNRNVGSRVLDRIQSVFGVKLSDAKLDRSTYIDSLINTLQIGDVMSTSDTTGANLGSYAGKGISYGNNNGKSFRYTTDEFGYFIIITTVIPEIGYFQGNRKLVEHRAYLDFFRPEFDALGVQAVPQRELMTYSDPTNSHAADADKLFGFIPRYAEYKSKLSELTGDFTVKSINAGKESWHLFREFGEEDNIALSSSFVQGKDWAQYQRIFYASNELNDKFNCINSFDVKFIANMKQLYDTYDFRDGQDLTIDVGGTHIN